MASLDQQIADVVTEIKVVVTEIKAVEAQITSAGSEKEKDQLRKKEEQLRKKEEQLREKELILLRQQQAGAAAAGPSSASTTAAASVRSMAVFGRPRVVLRIKFSFLNMQHIRNKLWRKMKEGGLWGSVRRTSASEVVCDVVCRFQNSAAFDDLIMWLNNIGVVETDRAAVGSDPTVLIHQGQPDDFCTSDEDALKMVGRREVVALSQHIRQKAPSTDPSDAASSHSSLLGADRYGP